jgi:ABC-type nitrate/sulfonate/bicarbonate transport system substrate-binding protein
MIPEPLDHGEAMGSPLLASALLALALLGACAAPSAPASPAASAPTAAARPAAAPAAPAETSAPAAAAVAPLPPRQVKIAYPSAALSQMEFMYAVDQGVYARHGVEVEGLIMTTAPAVAALINGDIQYVYSGSTLLLSAARGLPMRTFWQGSRGPTMHLFARPDITSFADLRGKTVSVLSPAGLSREVTELVIEKNGVNPRDVQYLASGTAPAQMEHLRQGLAVAASISPPWPVLARREGYHSLANVGQQVPYPFGLFATTTTRIADDPAEVKALIRGTIETHRLLRDDPATAIDWIARRFDVDQEIAAESYTLVIEVQNVGGEVPRDAVANYFRVQQEATDLREPRYEDVVEARLLQEVWRELGLR